MVTQFKTLFRRLARHRLFTALNVFGLAVGIAACWIIFAIVSYEFSFENGLDNRDKTYRLITGFVFDEKESFNGGVSKPVYQAIREHVNGVERVVPVVGQWFDKVKVERINQEPLEKESPRDIVEVDSAYFGMVKYKWLAGDARSAMAVADNIVLTQSRALSYFGNVPPDQLIGKQLLYNDTIPKRLAGIVADLDYPTEFTGQEFLVLKSKVYSSNDWTSTGSNSRVYLQVKSDSDTAKIAAQVTSIAQRKWDEYAAIEKPTWQMKRRYEMMPLTQSHFATEISDSQHKASKPVLYGLMGLGGFLLLLACINYINLSTALVPQRSKEIGVRKVLGSGRRALMSEVMSETFVTVILAIAFAFVFAKLGFGFLGDIVPPGTLEYFNVWKLAAFLVPMLLLVTLLSGWYPAWLIAKVQPVSIMRGQGLSGAGNNRQLLRKALIVFQFVIAQVFIVVAVIMGSQLKYTLEKDMGFDKEAVLLVDLPGKLLWDKKYNNTHFSLQNELSKHTGIGAVSLADEPLENGYSSDFYEYADNDSSKEPINRNVFRKSVDTSYLSLYGIQLLAGRNLHAADTVRELVINETAARAFGFKTPQEALGKFIGRAEGKFPVVGVVKDFHIANFHKTIDPVALMTDRESPGIFNIKLNTASPSKWQQTIKEIEEKWNSFYPAGTFSYRFYDQQLERMYKEERNLSTLINLATVIAIVISCLGLFGLAIITSFQRTKEIGIRKVLGASVSGIVRILSSDFIRLVLIALVIASPIAWWAMNKWLSDFAYRVQISWWMFVLTGIMAMIIALLTVGFHAVKAAVANPVKALRSE
jgi:ABC-type antimicrobial peptide transport system permease subunit